MKINSTLLLSLAATAFDGFQKKTLNTTRGYTYTYYVADGDSSLPALFFQHGWPDNAAMWKDIATPLLSTNHPMIIPDMLGYDGTDKPADPAEYKWDVMTKDLIEIINAEGHPQIISIGHDWGSACASRMYNYYPDRVAGLVNMNVAYMPLADAPFNLTALNAQTEQAFGLPLYSYWDVHAAPDGPKILHNNIERMYQAMHGVSPTMEDIFCHKGRMRDHLLNGSGEIALRPYAQDPAFKQDFVDRMSRDGFQGPQSWYYAAEQSYHYEADKLLPKDRSVVNVPVLYIGCAQDPVSRPEAINQPIQSGLLPQLEQAELIDAAHWVAYEKPEEVVTRLESWLGRHYAQK
jgi:soluble epoxide hydrolase/lipid-phosphate phosphatase